MKKGKIKPVGGRPIVQELNMQKTQPISVTRAMEASNIAASDHSPPAEWNHAQAVVAATISGLEQLQNSGKEAIIDLLMLVSETQNAPEEQHQH